ncbi:DUF2262 domain-containing protein [Deinococcus sp. PESE-13]
MPQNFRDDVLGDLTYDEQLEGWEGTFGTPEVSLWLSGAEGDGAGQDRLPVYRDAFLRLRRDEPGLRRHIAEQLTDLAEDWREPEDDAEDDDGNDGQPITPESFLERIALTNVTLYADGSAELFYSDGDLFAGHVIIGSVDRNSQLTDASIAG